MKSVSEVLNAAADLLEKPGAWTQGVYHGDDDTCHCVTGAIAWVQGRRVPSETDDAAVVAVSAQLGLKEYEILGWNDEPGRNQAEVVAALRQAAEQADQ